MAQPVVTDHFPKTLLNLLVADNIPELHYCFAIADSISGPVGDNLL